jgi:Do/DeqQ family serine protease
MKLRKNIFTVMLGFLGGILAISFFSFNNADNIKAAKTEKVTVSSSQQRIDLRAAAKHSVQAVVHVKTTHYGRNNDNITLFDFIFGEGGGHSMGARPVMGSGSGVIISEDGYIVTNNHVIDKTDRIEVILNDKRSFKAKLVGADPTTDLALLKIEAKGLKTLSYGDSNAVNLGEWVLAVGNPFNLNSTVTAGIISAKARSLGINGSKMSIESFLQTDAAVNPGNSGGALVNSVGELIGINTAISSMTGSYVGYSFAIPSNIVRKVVDDLKEYGEVQRAFIGVFPREIDSEFAKSMDIDKIRGVWVAQVAEGGAAANSGIKAGDIIIDIDKIKINSVPELMEQVGRHNPGDKISVKVDRDGKEKLFVLELQNRNGNTNILKTKDYGLLGAKYEKLSDKEKYRYRINRGIKIVDIIDGKLKSVGVQQGFIILKINDIIIYDKDDIEKAIRRSNDGGVFITGISPYGKLKYYAFSMYD